MPPCRNHPIDSLEAVGSLSNVVVVATGLFQDRIDPHRECTVHFWGEEMAEEKGGEGGGRRARGKEKRQEKGKAKGRVKTRIASYRCTGSYREGYCSIMQARVGRSAANRGKVEVG
jgi:hypothetical protein